MTKFIARPGIILGLAAALVVSVASPSSARNRWVGPAVGFAASVAVGAAAATANANAYYSDPYYAQAPYASYYGPDYYYGTPAYSRYYRPNQKCSPENAGRTDAGC